MRISQAFYSVLICATLTAGWPWPPSILGNDELIVGRQDNGPGAKSSGTASASASATASPTNNAAASTAAASTAATSAAAGTNNAKPSGSAAATTDAPTKTTGRSASSKLTAGPKSTFIDPRKPAGRVQLLTPAPLATTTYYKVGQDITFAWNYTNLIVSPSQVDVLVSCTSATYTIASNMTVKGTGLAVWDTNKDKTGENALGTDYYTLVIYDASQPMTAVAGAGRLARYGDFKFGMYTPQPYTARNGFVCATCSGALSNMERQTLKFLFGMAAITVLSFTWFAGGFLAPL